MEQNTTGVFVIYSRKSRVTGKGKSVENQAEMCRRYIASVYGTQQAETALVYEDEGFSGGNLERPQFKQMMQDSHEQKFAAIVVYRLDRISRNIGDFAKLIEDLGQREIDFISIREQFDTASPMGRAMMYIASVFSQLERETIAERIRDNLHELAKTGRWLGGNTPTGYASESVTSVSVDGKPQKAYHLKPVPEEVSLVKKIFARFMETGSLTKVDQYLLERQAKTKRGKNFTRFSIRGILTNPVYMIADEDAYDYLIKNNVELFADKTAFDGVHGVMAYNRTLQRPGKTNQIRPMNEWIVSVGRHPGMVPGAVWVSVQETLERNKTKHCRSSSGSPALLSGLLICGQCGDSMRPKKTGRTTADGKSTYIYLCTMKERSHRKLCDIKNANGNMLDAMVVDAVKKLGKSSHETARQILQIKRVLYDNQAGFHDERAQVQTQIAEIDTQIKRLIDALSRAGGTAAESYIVEQIEALNQSSEAYHRHLEKLESITKQHELTDREFNTLRQTLSQFGQSMDASPVEQQRAAIRVLVKRVAWDGDTVHLYVSGGDEDMDSHSSR